MNFAPLTEYLSTLHDVGIPLFDVAVMQEHELIYRMASGFSDHAGTKPVSEDDLYWFFSATKLFTCAAGMQLLCAGKLSLDDPLSRYFPEFAHMKIEQKGVVTDAQNPILIRHLFTMTAGFTYNIKTPAFLAAREADPDADTCTLIRALAGDPLAFEPGTHFLYSLCHDVLAAVVEVVSGERFSDYLQKHIFAPLGITSFGFRLTPAGEARMAAQFVYNTPLNQVRPCPAERKYSFTPNYDSGGAGLFGTVGDYILFVDALANGGVGKSGARILPEAGVCMMQKNLLNDDSLRDFRASPRKYGYGWGLCGRVHMSPLVSLAESPAGEFGWDGAAGAYALIDPVNKLSIFFGTHVLGCTYAYEKIHPTVRDLVERAIRA